MSGDIELPVSDDHRIAIALAVAEMFAHAMPKWWQWDYSQNPADYRELLQRRFGAFDFVRQGVLWDVLDRLEGDAASLRRMRERLRLVHETEFGWRPADLPAPELPAKGVRLVVDNA